jgi:hypothetical protein
MALSFSQAVSASTSSPNARSGITRVAPAAKALPMADIG